MKKASYFKSEQLIANKRANDKKAQLWVQTRPFHPISRSQLNEPVRFRTNFV